jgi:signal transduction histidine kinase
MIIRMALLQLALSLIIVLAVLVIRRQRDETNKLKRQSSEAVRLGYVGTLAAGLAHEIRNPLNALAMQLELLEEDVSDGTPQTISPRLQRIRKGLGGVERTVHDFLTYATPGRQRPQVIELAPVIEPVCAEFRESDLGPVDVECNLPAGLMAWCDPHALRQILSNLMTNALRAQRNPERPRRLRLDAARNGPWIDIIVEDAGTGVPDDIRDRLFEVFYTTSSDGTGLGLPIARRLAEMNGGELDLLDERSALGGARFRLRLWAKPHQRRLVAISD